MRAWLTSLASICGCAALLASCGRPTDDAGFVQSEQAMGSILATMAAGGGGLQVKRKALAFWEPATVGATFMAGDWVQSGPGGFARIEFVPGGRLDVESSAIVVIDAQATDPATGGGNEALLAVESGIIRGVLRKPGQTVGIRAPDGSTARLTSRGGTGPVEYRLAKRPKGTEVAIHKGAATLMAKQATRDLTAGQAADVAHESVGPVVELLRAPSLQSPESDAALVVAESAAVNLAWRSVASAAGYRVQLSPREDFLDVVETLDADSADATFRPTRPGAYFWRVSTRDSEGRYGLQSAPRRFVVLRPATAELLIEPEPGAKLSAPKGTAVTFRWHSAQEGGYRFVVARGGTLDGTKAVDEVTLETEARVTLKPGLYTWGVYAFADEETARPLFLKARALVIDSTPTVNVPTTLKDWGQ